MADILLNRHDKPIDKQRKDAIDVLKDGIKTIQTKAGKVEILWHLANLYFDACNSPYSPYLPAAVDCISKIATTSPRPCALIFSRPGGCMPTTIGKRPWRAREVLPRTQRFSAIAEVPQLLDRLLLLQQGNPDQAMAAFRRA